MRVFGVRYRFSVYAQAFRNDTQKIEKLNPTFVEYKCTFITFMNQINIIYVLIDKTYDIRTT